MDKGLKFILNNASHCVTAQDMLYDYALKENCDIILITEPYLINNVIKGFSGYKIIQNKFAAICVLESVSYQQVLIDHVHNIVVISIQNLLIINVYFSPNKPIEPYLGTLDNILSKLQHKRILLTGDMNVRSKMWDRKNSGKKTKLFHNFLASHNLIVTNEKDKCIHSQTQMGKV